MGPIIIIRIDVDIVDDYNNYDDDPPVRISYRHTPMDKNKSIDLT